MYQATLRLLLVSTMVLFGFEAYGKTLTDTQIYKRCYAQLTESIVPLNDARMARVRANAVTGPIACIELLNEGRFDTGGRLVRINPVSMKIVRTFNSLHRSWFTATRLEDISDYEFDINPNTPEVFDQTEQALFLTRFLLTPNLNYRDMLRGNRGVRAIRQEDPNALMAPGSRRFNIPNVGRYLYPDKPERNENKFGFQRGDVTVLNITNDYIGVDITQY
ncbi:MAG: hypothetical protein EOP09_20160, partial [Proteobacteria bacterium]